MMPVRPPTTTMTKSASTKYSGVFRLSLAFHRVASQQKICTADGIATAKLAAVKKLLPTWGRLVANMWCTQRPKAKKAVAASASTMAT